MFWGHFRTDKSTMIYQLFMNFCCAPKLNSKMEGNLHSELGVRDAYVLAFFKTRVGWNLFR